MRQKCDFDDLSGLEGSEPRQLRAVAIGRGIESRHFSQKGGLGGAQGMVQQVLPIVSLMHRGAVVGDVEFHDVEVEVEMIADRAGLRCGSLHQDAVVRVHGQAVEGRRLVLLPPKGGGTATA